MDKLKWIFTDEDYLSKDKTNCLKGIFAVMIVLAHSRSMTTVLNDTLLGQLLTVLGYLSVAFFFFLTGYGLVFSYKKSLTNSENKYILRFPRNRLLDFYAKYIILALIYFLYNILMNGEFLLKRLALTIIIQDNIIVFGWYLQAALMVYFAFWIVMRFVGVKNFALKTLLIVAVFVGLVFLLQENRKLFLQSFLALPGGMLWCEYKDEIDKLLFGKKYFISLGLLFVTFGVFLVLGNLNILDPSLSMVAKMISSPLFVFFVLVVTKPFNISNIITKWLGKVSFEIYVFQGIFLNVFVSDKVYIDNFVLYFIVSLLATIGMSAVLNPMFTLISKKIKK